MEDNPTQSTENQLGYQSPQTKKKSKKFLYIILFVILLPVVIFAIQKLFFSPKEEAEIVSVSPTPTEFQFPTDTPTPTPDEDEEEDDPDTSTSTDEDEEEESEIDPVDSATGLDRSTLSVEVQNGSGVAGVAGEAADILRDFGYEIASTGNADDFDYEDVTIQVKSTKVNFLELLEKDLGFSYTIGSSSSDLDSSSAADALVIIGQ